MLHLPWCIEADLRLGSVISAQCGCYPSTEVQSISPPVLAFLSLPPSLALPCPFQVEGVRFMWQNCIHSVADVRSGREGMGCILAHAMGLGKTVQVGGREGGWVVSKLAGWLAGWFVTGSGHGERAVFTSLFPDSTAYNLLAVVLPSPCPLSPTDHHLPPYCPPVLLRTFPLSLFLSLSLHLRLPPAHPHCPVCAPCQRAPQLEGGAAAVAAWRALRPP